MKLLPLLALLGGCSFAIMRDTPTYRYQDRCKTTVTPAIVDAAVAITAAIVTIKTIRSFPANSSEAEASDKQTAIAAGIAAAVFSGSSAYGFRSALRCQASPPHETLPEAPPQPIAASNAPLSRDAPLIERIPAADPNAAQLTRDVHREALIGNCTRTRDVAVEVKEADSAYYVQVFLTDAAIARCLRATPGPAVP